MTYMIFESPPSTWRGEVPQPRNSGWEVAVFRVVAETEKRVYVEFAGGDEQKVPRDNLQRLYIEKAKCGRAWTSGDLSAVLAYRDAVRQRWASTCAAKDAGAAPHFAEIGRLQNEIRVLEDIRDADIVRIRDACPRPSLETEAPSPPVAVEAAVEPVPEPATAGPASAGPCPCPPALEAQGVVTTGFAQLALAI